MSMKPWIAAARLRTLPLAVSTMIMGHSLAAAKGQFNWWIAILSVLTAVSLQVLSNLSNDYGDSIHGADNESRIGPSRAVQSGAITAQKMKSAMKVMATITFVFGLPLLYIAFDSWSLRFIFLILGLIAIWAAINYTAGSKPYGYRGKGDISVFIFFGLLTVVGSYYLQTQSFDVMVLLPALSCGALSVGVLNVNNIRDIDSDSAAGKRSIPVQIGRRAAIIYHAFLLAVGIISLVLYGILADFDLIFNWLFLIMLPMFIINFRAVNSLEGALLDPYLKQLALSTAILILLFCGGLLFS